MQPVRYQVRLVIARDAWEDRRAQHTEFSPDHDPADRGAQR